MVKTARKSGCRFARKNLHKNFEGQLPSYVGHVCFEQLEARMLFSATPIQLVANANNQFAVDLYQQLGAQGGNVFFSPYSISSALDMALQGANGLTAQEMIDVLRLPAGDVANAGAQALYQLLNVDPAVAGYELSVANKLWGNEGFMIKPEYQEIITELFGAAIETIDFGNPQQAADTINAWVREKTHGKIDGIISPSMINRLTRLVLVNAIYFRGDWASPFSKNDSVNGTFHLNESTGETVKMMKQTQYYSYYEDANMQAVALPYKRNNLDMLIMLPKSVSMDGLDGSLNFDYLETINSGLQQRRVALTLPAFEIRGEYSLNQTLADMGMPTAFTDNADFSGISNIDLQIQKVIHKSYIKVDEKGSEAAAVTAILLGATSAMQPPPPTPTPFVANHPFLFAIREHSTGAILFMGRLSNADPNAATFAATYESGFVGGVSPIPNPGGGGGDGIIILPNPMPTLPPTPTPEEPVVIEQTPIPDDAWWAIAAPPPSAAVHHTHAMTPAVSYVAPMAAEFSPLTSSLDSSAGIAMTAFVATTPAVHTDYSPYYTYVGSDVIPQSTESQKPETIEESSSAEDQQSASAEKDDKDELLN